LSDLSDISFLTVYNSVLISGFVPFGLYLMKKISDLCAYRTKQEQKEIDKEKYEGKTS